MFPSQLGSSEDPNGLELRAHNTSTSAHITMGRMPCDGVSIKKLWVQQKPQPSKFCLVVDGEGIERMTWDGQTEVLLVLSRAGVPPGLAAHSAEAPCPGSGCLQRQEALLRRGILLQHGQAGSGPFVPPVPVPRARAQPSTNPRVVSGTDCSASP